MMRTVVCAGRRSPWPRAGKISRLCPIGSRPGHNVRAVAALTNNWAHEGGGGSETDALRDLFDVFVESSKVGLRKPDPRIYAHVCEALAIAPRDAVFLDDIGRNLKTARELGMTTIKVDEPEQALAQLSRHLSLPL